MGASGAGRWAKHFKDANTSIQSQTRSGRPQTASTEPKKKRVDDNIKEDRHVTLDAIAIKLGIGHNAVQEMNGSLDYRRKVILQHDNTRPYTALLTLQKN